MSEDFESPPGYPTSRTLYRAAAGLLLGAAGFLVATVLTYVSEAGHLHRASWLGFLLGGVLVAVLAGFVLIQVRLRHERQRRSAHGLWLALAGVGALVVAGVLSPAANTTYGGALLVGGLGVCLGLGVTALHLARHPADGQGS